MDIKNFIKESKVKTLPGNAFKFLLELYSMTDKEGKIENFTILGFIELSKKEERFCTGRNTLARFIDEFENRKILIHDRYKKTITFYK
jgi:hypothetical protein